MTDTPNLSALAMRTKAAALMATASQNCRDKFIYPPKTKEQRDYQTGALLHGMAATAILALPLEADPAALVTEAMKLPQIVALHEALEPFAKYMIAEDDRMDRDAIGLPMPDKQGVGWIYLTYQDFRRAEAALTALEQP